MNRIIKVVLVAIIGFMPSIAQSQIFSLKDSEYDLLVEDLQVLYNYAERAKNRIKPYKSFETENLLVSDFSKPDRCTILYEVASANKDIFDFIPDVMKTKLKLDFVRDEVDKKQNSMKMIYRDCRDGLKITVTHFSDTKRIFISVQWFDQKIRHRILELYDCQS